MTKLLEAKLDNGDIIRIEVESTALTGGIVEASRSEDITKKANDVLYAAMDTIKATSTLLVETVQGLNLVPDEIQIKFGVKIDFEAGAMVAKVGTEAQYDVTLIWKQDLHLP